MYLKLNNLYIFKIKFVDNIIDLNIHNRGINKIIHSYLKSITLIHNVIRL